MQTKIRSRGGFAALAFTLAGLGAVQAAPPKPDPQMKAVLGQLAALHPKPIETLSATEARRQPGPPDAVKALLKKRGKSADPEPVAKVENRVVPGLGGAIPVRVYTPEGTGPFPVLVYFHGGGWVIAGVQAYDATPRALANLAKCVVVSVGYRSAPEFKFPSAHEDCYVATQYILRNADQFGGDPSKVAVGGESAGGNLAAAVCLMARDRSGKMPVAQLLVYPVTDVSLNYLSVRENAQAKPLNAAMLPWFYTKYLPTPAAGRSPYFSIVHAKSLRGLPPATVVAAQIDPLRSEGKAYADKLRAAGVPVRYRLYPGVTHEFFGMAAVVDKSKAAERFAAAGLTAAFNK